MGIIMPEFIERTPKEATWQMLDRATAQRKRLLDAGYVPAPTAGKRPVIDGWQDIQPTEGIIDWQQRSRNRALRLGPQTGDPLSDRSAVPEALHSGFSVTRPAQA